MIFHGSADPADQFTSILLARAPGKASETIRRGYGITAERFGERRISATRDIVE